MGLETSREEVVDFEKLTENRTKDFWKNVDTKSISYAQFKNHGTRDVTKALPIISDILKTFFKDKKPDILEVGSGNGYNTKKIYDEIKDSIGSLTATDMIERELTYYDIEKMKSHEAVKKNDCDILLFVSPPPNRNYMDYYAIKEYEESKNDGKDKNIIFVGELGAGDGTSGMYNYMMKHKQWKCKKRVLFRKYELPMGAGTAEREVFYFSCS